MLLVTGGLGFIGSKFVTMALEGKLGGLESSEIAILDNHSYAANLENLGTLVSHQKLQVINGDVRNASLVDQLVSDSDCVIHFAAESHVDRSIEGPSVFIETNILGTTNLVNASEKWKKRILVVSTDEVYGSLDEGEANEDSILNPSSPYSASKSSADLVALSYYKTFGTDVVITRSANNYGPNQHNEKFIPTVIKSIKTGNPIPIYGNGKNVRNWIHVEDHCSGIALALDKGKSGEIYNFGTEEYLENLEICKLFLDYVNEDYSRISFVEDRKGHDFRYGVNSMKARKSLGWKTVHNFNDSVEELFNSY
jgi:dTDP-glucose 4,6-dehydratase